jgi:hypothetical protein
LSLQDPASASVFFPAFLAWIFITSLRGHATPVDPHGGVVQSLAVIITPDITKPDFSLIVQAQRSFVYVHYRPENL